MAPYFMRNLVLSKEKRAHARPLLVAFREVTLLQYMQYFSGWLSWTCDAIDFFAVSLSVTRLEAQFGKSANQITTAITLTLLFRSVGAIVFGFISDRYGRKWPLIWNLLFIAVLELGASFVQTFNQFLALRSLFGIGMGGIWGLAAATALENLPVETRGIASGFLQEGYPVGSLIAAVINLTLVPEVSSGWRSLFWVASGITLLAAFIRMMLPESEYFIRVKAAERARGSTNGKNKTKIFLHETKEMLKAHWLLCIYAILLLSGFNFLSHASQDLYPTYLQASKGFSPHDSTVATIIGSTGAIVGGVIAGFMSQYIGRRLTIIIYMCLTGAFIPLWILPSSFSGLAGGAFCIQFFLQGAWGVMPILLAEISPPAFRATFPGVAYQLGNMVSSASVQIETTWGEHLRTTIVNNGVTTNVPNYGTIQGILIGIVVTFVLILIIIGPEKHGSHFEKAKAAFEEGAGRAELPDDDDTVDPSQTDSRPTSTSDDKRSLEKV